jgi:hypothetical protein
VLRTALQLTPLTAIQSVDNDNQAEISNKVQISAQYYK